MPCRPPPDASTLQVEEIGTAEGLERLRPEWAALWRQARPAPTPFQSPAWLIPWWRHVGEGALLTLAARDATGRLVGLAPLYIHTAAGTGRRSVFPLGIATTDYLDALVAPGWQAAVMRGVFAHLAAERARWEVCDWPQLRPGSPLGEAPAPQGWRAQVGEAEPCPVLALPPPGTPLDGAVPRETLQSLHRRRARMARRGALRAECATESTLAALLEAHLRLHGARWEARGEAGVLAPDPVQAMHREALPALLRDGLLRLHALRLDEAVVATLLVLADPPGRAERRHYFYLGGFDPAFARLSPGMLLVGHAIEQAAREGAAAVDFLRGREAHKYAWGARDAPTFRRTLWLEEDAPPCAAADAAAC